MKSDIAGLTSRSGGLFLDAGEGSGPAALSRPFPVPVAQFAQVPPAEILPTLQEPFFRAMIEAVPAAIYATDASGRITYYNEAAAKLWGVRPELGKSEFCGSWKLYRPDGTPLPHDQCPMALALREKRPILGMEAIAERPDGTRVPFQPFPTPIFDDRGELIGAVNMLVELAERQEAEHVAQRLAAIVESSNDAIIGMDLEATIVSWNAAAEKLFRYGAAEVLGHSVIMLLPDDRKSEENDILGRIRRGERVEHYETKRRRKDGEIIDISLTVSPIRDARGRIVGASKIARDITERRKSEEAKSMLLAEMKHRIKNNLATVQAFATMTLKSATAAERNDFVARLHALGGAHDLITNQQWDRASLRNVVSNALKPFEGKERNGVTYEGPELEIDSNKVLLLSLALHELATNAVKYGALSIPGGNVSISWTGIEAGTLIFRWQESGGPKVTPLPRRGFGSQLIERVFSGEQGTAELEFRPEGLVCTLHMQF
jgi:two-component system CheB/CheR fusion protein